MHPRAAAFELLKIKKVCAEKGNSRDDMEPCRRCGELVKPKLDWSGHP